jgi:hypothetical protein
MLLKGGATAYLLVFFPSFFFLYHTTVVQFFSESAPTSNLQTRGFSRIRLVLLYYSRLEEATLGRQCLERVLLASL